jgi:AcrR family transcriptional regulator
MTRPTSSRKEKDQTVNSALTGLSDGLEFRPTEEQPSPKRRRKNMRSEDREKQILEEAVRFFAECGFEGQTRELATRLGVSHAVIYRHFQSKEELIQRVYEHVYTSRWRSEWNSLITIRNLPLEDRLLKFYREYVDCVFEYEWVRIFIYSGLKSYSLPARYLTIIRDRIIRPAIAEMRHELKLTEKLPCAVEEELFWGLHGGVFYVAIRKFIYETDVPEDIAGTVARTVRASLTGIRAQMTDAGT